MHPEPESTNSPDVLGTNADTPTDPPTDSDVSFLDLEPTESQPISEASEAAVAIDLELDEAVKQSAFGQNPRSQDNPIGNLYASLLPQEEEAEDSPFPSNFSFGDESASGEIEPKEEPDAGDPEPLRVFATPDSSDAPGPPASEMLEGHPPTTPSEVKESEISEISISNLSEEEPSSTEIAPTPTEVFPQEPKISDGVETIRALTDLIPEIALETGSTEENTNLRTWEALQANPEAPLTEDDYLLASPEENLLSGDSNEPLLEQEQNLQLDSTMMEQLESDLHRLEDVRANNASEDVEEADGELDPEIALRPGELSDEDLDAIFPAFLLGETPEEAAEDVQTNNDNTEGDTVTVEPPPESPSEDELPPKTWYLGIDFGTTGLCAVLLNRLTGALYPIYWVQLDGHRSKTRFFRLPAAVYFMGEDNADSHRSEQIAAVGPQAFEFDRRNESDPSGWLLQHFKSWLNLGLPWHDDEGREQPQIQLSDDRRIPLGAVQRACQALFAAIERGTLADNRFGNAESGWPDAIPIPVSPHLPISPFPHPSISQAIEQLAGVIVNAPVAASEAYRFNIREALIRANLVQRPEQIMFVEDAIATVLSALPGDPIAAGTQNGWELSPDWQGTTLAINAGASSTELVLVNFPDRLQDLHHDCFARHSFSYGGDAIDRDIICQLLLDREEIAAAVGFDASVPLPQPGEPDRETRVGFDRWLQSTSPRRSLLEAATSLKFRLQEQEQHTVHVGTVELTVMRRDLEARVLLPYVQQVNRELNRLLSQTGVVVEGIDRALCTGGTASWEALALWLRQKLPNAIVMQDVYPSDRLPGCSRVAYGLATLPLYPQVLDELPQQYSDYFLVRELLEVCPDETLSEREILARLEGRGLNARACRDRVIAIVTGQLPQGLVPSSPEAGLSVSSQQHPVYRALRSAPLFERESAKTYRPNREQFERLHQYFHKVAQNCEQTWQEPLAIRLSVPKIDRHPHL